MGAVCHRGRASEGAVTGSETAINASAREIRLTLAYQRSLASSALDRVFRLDDHGTPGRLGPHHGCGSLAAEPWPRTV